MYKESERLYLRDFKIEDLNDLHEIFGDNETMKNCEPAYTIDKTKDFLENFCIARKCAYAAVEKETNKVIGYTLLKPYGEPDVYEIGWIFNRNYWCRGYAFEICSKLIEYAFTGLNAEKIFAEAIDGVKSVGLMKKLGMIHEGTQRKQTRDCDGNLVDLYLYGILKEEFESANK